jgi:hypothetical protein
MILLWGIEEDAPLSVLLAALRRRGSPFFFLDQRKILESHVAIDFLPAPRGRIQSPDGEIDVASIRAAYLRSYNARHFPDLASCGDNSPKRLHAALFEDILWSFAELAPALVLNRPSAMTSNNSKPYQMDLIARSGFLTPDTLITTLTPAPRARHQPSSTNRSAAQHRGPLTPNAWPL